MKFVQNKILNKFEVECKIEKNKVNVKGKGPMGVMEKELKLQRNVYKIKGINYFKKHSDSRNVIGIVKQVILSVIAGYCVELKIVGLGYVAYKSKNKIILDLGYSHFISCEIPNEILLQLEGSTILLYSINKEKVTTFASNLKRIKPINPYKGTGIREINEQIKLKKGKVR